MLGSKTASSSYAPRSTRSKFTTAIENSLTDVQADGFDLHQGYLEARDLFVPCFNVRAGRQEISLGEERLIGAVDWTQNARSLDGAVLTYAWDGGGWVKPFWALLALLGFPPWMIFLQQSVSLIYQFGLHTEKIDRLPRPVEYVMNTPSHHRVHHGANEQYLDRNYGGILIIWDRIFGTLYVPTEHEHIKYGIGSETEDFRKLGVIYGRPFTAAADHLKKRFGKAEKQASAKPVSV